MASLLMFGEAHADGPVPRGDNLIPPLKYASGPPIAPIETFVLPRGEITAICRDHAVMAAGSTGQIAGCALFTRGSDFLPWDQRSTAEHCSIFVVSADEAHDPYDLLIAHEEAHCRGWAPDHPY